MRLRSFFSMFVLVVSSSLLLGTGQAHGQIVTDRCLGGVGTKCIPTNRLTERLVARIDVYTGYPDDVPHIMGPSPAVVWPNSNKVTIDIRTSLIPGVGRQSRSLRVKIPGLVASGQNGTGTAIVPYRARLSRISGWVIPSTGSCGRQVLLSARNVKLADSDVQYDDHGEAFVEVALDAKQDICLYSSSSGQPVDGGFAPGDGVYPVM
jgi:hypothetical protein